MADELMYIPNNNAQNYPFCRLILVVELKRLNIKLHEPKNQNSRIRIRYYKTLGTSLINRQHSYLSHHIIDSFPRI